MEKQVSVNPETTKQEEAVSLIFPATAVFSVTLSTVFLQLVQTRIYSVVYWNHLVYFIISIALLGFGISGTWLSFGEESRLARVLTLRKAAIGFILATVFSSVVVPRLGINLSVVLHALTQLVRLLVTYAAAVVPYFFAGWILGTLYRDYAKHIHFLYFADLVGAAVGCFAFLVFIRPLGAVNCVLLACVFVGVPILAANAKAGPGFGALALVLAFLLTLFILEPRLSSNIIPEPTKSYHALYSNLAEGDEKVIEVSEWNAISRIDVVSTKKKPGTKKVFIDGDAWTGIVETLPIPPPPFDTDKEMMLMQRTPYLLHTSVDKVLVIGMGGGHDVWLALRAGAKHVDAVEINPTTARLMVTKYKEVSNDLLGQPGVNLHVEDGRSFVRRCTKKYDVIMMHAVDTLTALASGAYVLSENYLYTVEAIMDYVNHLEPGGVLCITRWEYRAEGPRLFNIGLEALYQLDVPNPEQCIMLFSAPLTTLLVRSTPFTKKEIETVRLHFEKNKMLANGTPRGEFLFPLEETERVSPSQRLLHRLANLRAEGLQQSLYDAYPLKINPVWDDSPFFFHFDKARNLLNVFRETGSGNLVRGHWPSFTLYLLLLLTMVAVALFMGLPLLKRGRSTVPRFGFWLAYFSCLGISFIFVEIALMQRFALLLGHPSRSIALVLAALLLSAGLGSHSRKALNISLKLALGIVVAVVLCAAFIYPKITMSALGLPLWGRALVTVALVIPLGFFMGMPFPTGIQMVSEHDRNAVPWMWGVNGGTTVLGSILAIILAIWMNFTFVLLSAALGYMLALLVFGRVRHGRQAGRSIEHLQSLL